MGKHGLCSTVGIKKKTLSNGVSVYVDVTYNYDKKGEGKGIYMMLMFLHSTCIVKIVILRRLWKVKFNVIPRATTKKIYNDIMKKYTEI